ncbi:MAG TPA: cyclase family protein [Terriglobales bacterium]
MKIRTFIVGYVLALALLLFAQRRSETAAPTGIREVVDLTHTINAQVPTYEPEAKSPYLATTVATVAKDGYFMRNISLPEHFGTHLDAPAHFVQGTWTVDQIPVERLVAPLVVIDVSENAKSNPDYQISVEDIAAWEKVHDQIPLNSVVMTRTGWDARWNSANDYRNPDSKGVLHFPGYSLDAAHFLVEGRKVLAIGIDTLSIDYGPSKDYPVHKYDLGHSVYQLENVANLDHAPVSGGLVVIAPMKLEGGSGAPVRILALAR